MPARKYSKLLIWKNYQEKRKQTQKTSQNAKSFITKFYYKSSRMSFSTSKQKTQHASDILSSNKLYCYGRIETPCLNVQKMTYETTNF